MFVEVVMTVPRSDRLTEGGIVSRQVNYSVSGTGRRHDAALLSRFHWISEVIDEMDCDDVFTYFFPYHELMLSIS